MSPVDKVVYFVHRTHCTADVPWPWLIMNLNSARFFAHLAWW